MRRSDWTRLLTFGALSGLIASLLIVPAVAIPSLAVKDKISEYEALSPNLIRPPLPQRSIILAADGSVLTEMYEEARISVPLTQMAPVARNAVLASEDARFYQHGPVDLRGILRATIDNVKAGRFVAGGSTLTQQYVKNVLIVQAKSDIQRKHARERGLQRKLREVRYAAQVEREMTKDQILEGYLNISYFGSGAYGIEIASRRYFSSTASALTLPQAALLASILPSPTAYAPTTNPKLALTRRNSVLRRMANLGMASWSDVDAAIASPLGLKLTRIPNGCTKSYAAYFCDFVRQTILLDPAYGKTKDDRKTLLYKGGLTIKTTLVPHMQRSTQASVNKHVFTTDRAATAVSMIEPGTGRVRAMAQSRPYGTTGGVNLNVDKRHGGSSGFQAGSTFKVFVAAAALNQGLGPRTSISVPPQVNAGGMSWKVCRTPPTDQGRRDPTYAPVNERPDEAGTYDMASALQLSINLYFILLSHRTGVCAPAKLAKAMGVQRADDGTDLHQYPSFTLGINEVAPLDMAEAYATFASRGIHCDAVPITAVTDWLGKSYPTPRPNCKRVLAPRIADVMNSMLQGTITAGTGRRAALGRPAAGKTGTTNGRVAAWFIGYTPKLAAAVWVGSPDDYRYHMFNVTIGGQFYRNVYGASLPAPLWHDAMAGSVIGLPPTAFAAGPIVGSYSQAQAEPGDSRPTAVKPRR